MKTTTILVALLVLALPVMAVAQNVTVESSDEGAAVAIDTGLSGGENVDISVSTTRPVLHALGVLGKGIAVSPTDPMDFMLVKVGLGAVKVTINGEVKKAAIGVLKLDGEKYRLKSVSVVDGRATGDIYKNGSKVGDFDIASVMKDDIEVWAGTMNLDGQTYHLYVIEGARRIRAPELREKVAEYCRNNPDDTNCRDKVEEYCQNNPEDARCKALFRKYCIAGRNMDDVRCREFVKDYCKENQNLRECVTLGIKRAKRYCDNNPDAPVCRKLEDRLVNFCKNHPDNEGCVRAKELLKNRVQVLNRIKQYVTKELSDLRTKASTATPIFSRTRIVSNMGG